MPIQTLDSNHTALLMNRVVVLDNQMLQHIVARDWEYHMSKLLNYTLKLLYFLFYHPNEKKLADAEVISTISYTSLRLTPPALHL